MARSLGNSMPEVKGTWSSKICGSAIFRTDPTYSTPEPSLEFYEDWTIRARLYGRNSSFRNRKFGQCNPDGDIVTYAANTQSTAARRSSSSEDRRSACRCQMVWRLAATDFRSRSGGGGYVSAHAPSQGSRLERVCSGQACPM